MIFNHQLKKGFVTALIIIQKGKFQICRLYRKNIPVVPTTTEHPKTPRKPPETRLAGFQQVFGGVPDFLLIDNFFNK